MHHRLHTLSIGRCGAAQRSSSPDNSTRSCIHCAHCVVVSCRCQHSWGLGGGKEPGWHCSVSAVRVLRWSRMFVLHKLRIYEEEEELPSHCGENLTDVSEHPVIYGLL